MASLLILPALRASDVETRFIAFDDLVDHRKVDVQWSWKALGQDPAGRIYVVFGGPTPDGTADCVLLRYDPTTGERRNLGYLSNALQQADNWRAGEHLEKGHTALPYVGGKILIGTQGFHDAAGGPESPKLRAALRTRGAHLIGYDVAADKLVDLSADQPGGVFYQGRGFLELTDVPGTDLVAAFTVPHGDLMLYDVARERVVERVSGVAERFGDRLGRIVLPAPNGRIFYAYHVNASTTEPGRMYNYDRTTGERCVEPTVIPPGVWNGIARSRDGQELYLSAQDGSLYRLDYEAGELVRIGDLLPAGNRQEYRDDEYLFQAPQVHGIAMTQSETEILCVPFRRRVALTDLPPAGERIEGGIRVADGIFVFNLATGISRRVAALPDALAQGYFTGNDTRDVSGAVYFARHAGPAWGLLRVSLP